MHPETSSAPSSIVLDHPALDIDLRYATPDNLTRRHIYDRPVALLRHLAHYPHQHATWLGLGHTVPNGAPAKPYAKGVEFTGAILLPPASAPEAFAALERDGKDIYFHCVVPLYQAEMDLVKRKGFPPLLDGFNEKGVTDLVVPGRKNTVKKFLGLF